MGNIDFSRYAVAAAAIGSIAAAEKSDADFISPYSLNPPPNGTYNNQPNGTTFGAWTVAENLIFSNTVNTSSAPVSLTISMSSSANGIKDFDLLTTAVATGLVSFNWNASLSATLGTGFAAFMLNGAETDLATQPSNGSSTPSGTFSIAVAAGDSFGFRVAHNYLGSAAMTISNFSAPVPEPSVIALVATGAVALVFLREARRRRVTKAD